MPQDTGAFLEDLRCALYAAKIVSYAQGFSMLHDANKVYGWHMNLGAIAGIFRGGCIIRADFLDRITEAFTSTPHLQNLLLDSFFIKTIRMYEDSWRRVVVAAVEQGIAIPTFTASLAYFDAYRDKDGPHNLLQAQRDYFGAHTFHRIDREGVFHHTFTKPRSCDILPQ
jgi:6-phosphogluconate dehydrogenase